MARRESKTKANPLSKLLDAGIESLELQFGSNEGLNLAKEALGELSERLGERLDYELPLTKWIQLIRKRLVKRELDKLRDFDHAAQVFMLPLKQADIALVRMAERGDLDPMVLAHWRKYLTALFALPNNKFDAGTFKEELMSVVNDWEELCKNVT